jgi:hypothetical protein
MLGRGALENSVKPPRVTHHALQQRIGGQTLRQEGSQHLPCRLGCRSGKCTYIIGPNFVSGAVSSATLRVSSRPTRH